MSKIVSLYAEERIATGKGPSRVLKVNQRIPAIIYGGNKNHMMLSLPEKELSLEYHKAGFMSHLFDIEIKKSKYRVIPKQVQLDPVTDKIIHVDFLHVNEHNKIKVSVPIEFTNKEKCLGIKHGGVLNALRHEIEVYCVADSIPKSIIIDLTILEIGHSVHLKDLIFPTGVTSLLDENLTIATITGSTKEVVVAAEAVSAAVPAADKKEAPAKK